MSESPEIPPVGGPFAEEIASFHRLCMSQDVLEALYEPSAVYGGDGTLLAINQAFREFWQIPEVHNLVGLVNLFTSPGVHPNDKALMRQALAGHKGMSPINAINLKADPTMKDVGRPELWMQTRFAPLHLDGEVRYVLVTFRDCSEEMRNLDRVSESEAMVARQRETIAALEAAQDHIRAQQATIRELSTPVIEVWPGVLTLPLVGHIDEPRAAEITERLLDSVTRLRARHVILDLTGVPEMDAGTSNHLMCILQAVPLLGARTMITGISPVVAQTIVEQGLAMPNIRTVRSLRDALAEILRQKR